MQTILHQRNKIWYVILRYEDLNGKIKDKRIEIDLASSKDKVKFILDSSSLSQKEKDDVATKAG